MTTATHKAMEQSDKTTIAGKSFDLRAVSRLDWLVIAVTAIPLPPVALGWLVASAMVDPDWEPEEE